MAVDLKLLTPELREKVENKVAECFKIAAEHYGQDFEMPEIRYNIKSWTGGLAYHQRWLVRFNLILLVENEQHYLDNVVPHEIAHLINRTVNKPAPGKKRLMPHGKEWKDVMKLLGVQASVTHTYDCSSIERTSRKKRVKTDKVERVLKQLRRLSMDDQVRLAEVLRDEGDNFRLLF
jgi:predicted SprT family Zn-dependent metalloprotease